MVNLFKDAIAGLLTNIYLMSNVCSISCFPFADNSLLIWLILHFQPDVKSFL